MMWMLFIHLKAEIIALTNNYKQKKRINNQKQLQGGNKTMHETLVTGRYIVDHTTFGGTIYFSDFCTDYRGSDQKESEIAKRIMSDWKFDKSCNKNLASRNKDKNYA